MRGARRRACAWVLLLAAFAPELAAQTITNTANVTYQAGASGVSQDSNTVSVVVSPPATPADVRFFQYAPGAADAQPLVADGGGYGGAINDTSGASYTPLPPPTTLFGEPIDLSRPVDVRETTVFHAGEPVFVVVTDLNRNADPSAREFINLTLTNPATGDTETLRLQETGPDTGVFAVAIDSVGPDAPAAPGDGRLSVRFDTALQVDYTDPTDPADTVVNRALVDPFGILFDAATGQPLNGGTITMLNADTGHPAAVFGDDGISRYPSTLTFGATATDSSGAQYDFPDGGYRFPFVAPGNYVFVITPPPGFTVPSANCTPASPAACPNDPNGNPYSVVQGSAGDRFVVMPGPALNIDIPAEPPADALQDLLLRKSVSQAQASAGDFLRYELLLENRGAAIASNVTITDSLPAGFRFQAGSLRIGGAAIADPPVSADGRTLTIVTGPLAAAPAAMRVSYVVEVVSGAAQREAINRARADDDGAAGGRHSNEAHAAVHVRAPLFGDAATIVGRVLESCPDTDSGRGVPQARVLLEDGRYVTTDRDGLFHFEGVRPGTHVVQLDLDSLAPGVVAVPRIQNSRFAGRAYSQFVDVRGGGLWRTDFHVCPSGAQVGLKLSTRRGVPTLKAGAVLEYSVRANFASGSDMLSPVGALALDGLVRQLKGIGIEKIEVIGHTDDQPLRAGPAAQKFGDNHGLSQARANVVGAFLASRLGLAPSQVQAIGKGPDQPVVPNTGPAGRAKNRRTEVRVYQREPASEHVDTQRLRHRIEIDGALPIGNLRVSAILPEGASFVAGSARLGFSTLADPQVDNGAVTFRLGDFAAGWQRVIEFDSRLPAAASACAAAAAVQALATFDAGAQANRRTPIVRNEVPCAMPAADPGGAGTTVASVREAVTVRGALARAAPAEVDERAAQRKAIRSDVEAAGGDRDWLAGAAPGIEWLYPEPGHSPRAPATRVVVKHAPGQTAVLRYVDGEIVHPLTFDGTRTSADGTVAVTVWRGVPLEEGDNRLEVTVSERGGGVAQVIERVVHYANSPARAELVPQESVLLADGIHPPVIAVRILDREGRPVRAGVTGGFQLNAPFAPRQTLEQLQQRQLAGLDRFEPTWRIEGDAGVAYIELEPTTESGEAVLNFTFQGPGGAVAARRQELRTWIAAAPRDWLVVGFAEGTVGYNTLKDNASAVPAGTEDELYTDGQASLYAKGRVLGQWLLTLAYDSDKPGELERRRSLLSTIDPDEYYTLYGDGAEQRFDAPSQDKLYLKLERGQFYGLFGDFDTGLTVTQLSRYSRSLNGVKSEMGGGPVIYSAFAAETAQSFVRDELRGDGTSGLYRLSRRGIVLNSERVRLETRDRFRSERVTATRVLARHLDYDIDYANGTLFFREPVPSRDPDFNPVFIVVEYETFGAGEKETTAGGRLGVRLLDGRLAAGLSGIREDQFAGAADLAGVDLRLRVDEATELRLEAAHSDGEQAALAREGDAWLAEVEHRGEKFDALAYSRRQEPGFGLNQQSVAEAGTDKLGTDLAYHFTPAYSAQGQLYRQEYLANGATREVGNARMQYRDERNTLSAGVQVATDETPGGEQFESQQLTFGVMRLFFDRALELSASGDLDVGGDNANVEFPSRFQLGAAYALTQSARLTALQEFTDGAAFDTSATRLGLQAVPWKGARLNSTLNQAAIGEAGPRTFAQMGLTQALLMGERWGFDVGLDSSRTLNESGRPAFVPNPDAPAAIGGGTLTDDFVALSAGATYRAELWSWNARAESRDGAVADRYGITTAWLRQATAGVAVSAALQAFEADLLGGAEGRYASASLSAAWRPLGSRWSILDRLQFKYDALDGGTGAAPAGGELFGNTTLNVAGSATSRRLINNLSLNRVSGEWTETDRRGNLFRLEQRSQWSLYYGAKYALDRYDGASYRGYTDLLGFEWRYDLTRRWDLGLQVSSLNSWENRTHEYSAGPQLGWSPATNGWISLGYNLLGFHDGDFDAARYTAAGPYLKLRFKFDQNTRAGADRADPRAQGWDEAAGGGGRGTP